ncbi:hypothetical protein T440DRAFT_554137 [Plenodomus tracheiphilus IPT5]|uniref:Uncharacterized protein n=1 Tax=Plenodomus tracheiphilus IPT5 TaxID=1408161 RepID=A0A6A7B8K8_9PLEO|nr:hypothetical protein T440DRAFT_554137 [Plenodomus tracheiphilus IPT5]
MLHSRKSSPFDGPSTGFQTYYGHQKVFATRCWHEVHPASSKHTPWCSTCAAARARTRLDAAQRNLVAEGGLAPAEYLRDRRWNTARIKHDIAKQRLERDRKRDQLRWEREQAWDEAHQQYDSLHPQAAADLTERAECPLCAQSMEGQVTHIPEVQIARDMTWWELPGGLVVEHGLMPETPPPSRNRRRKPECRHEGSKALHQLIQRLRAAMYAADVHRQAWNARRRNECAVRRKHGLGEDFQIYPEFWDSPISGYISLRNHQQIIENQRVAERKARGNTTRLRPPRSSLSYSETSEGWEVDQDLIETLSQEEERARISKAARKVAEEVGYLYFVGAIDGIEEWRDDFMRSDRNLIVRTQVPNSETSGSEDSADGDSKNEDEYDEEDIDKMDVDEP